MKLIADEPIRKQVRSGVRLGVGVGLFLLGGIFLGSGMDRAVWSATPPNYIVWPEPIGWTELAIAAAILIASAQVWWQLLAGYMLIGSFKSVIVCVTGRDLFAPHRPFPRPEAAALAAFAALTILLMWRFTRNRPTMLDRIALTAYLFCFMWRADRAEFSAAGPGLAAGLGCLLLAWAYERIRRPYRVGHASPKNHASV
jgi:hypothetical protein